jgi:hypothetical protein
MEIKMNPSTPITRSILDTPKWADPHQTDFTTSDLVDVWKTEALIHTNENDRTTAYFIECIDDHGDPYHDMTGISIDDGHGTAFYGMDRVTSYLPRNTILRLEEAVA